MRTTTLLLLALTLALPCAATTLLRLDFDQLARQADLVVVGRVTDITTEVDPRTGVIATVGRLETEKVVAGIAPAPTLKVVTLGGRMGNIRQVVAGAAQLQQGAEVALFLRSLGGDRTQVVAMLEGKFDVVLRGDVRAVKRAGGFPVMDPSTGDYGSLETVVMSLEEFEAQVVRARAQR